MGYLKTHKPKVPLRLSSLPFGGAAFGSLEGKAGSLAAFLFLYTIFPSASPLQTRCFLVLGFLSPENSFPRTFHSSQRAFNPCDFHLLELQCLWISCATRDISPLWQRLEIVWMKSIFYPLAYPQTHHSTSCHQPTLRMTCRQLHHFRFWLVSTRLSLGATAWYPPDHP